MPHLTSTSDSSAAVIRMLRIALIVASAAAALAPHLLLEHMRGILDAVRGNQVDPQKLQLVEVSSYLLAAALLAAVLLAPRIVATVERLVRRYERGGTTAPARRARASDQERTAIVVFLVLAVVLPVQLLLNQDRGIQWALEDGPIETGTAILYLAATGCCLLAAWRMRRHNATRIALNTLAALFFLVGMEEMSWGQRFLGLQTPASLATLNVQGEINLHNVWSTSINEALALLVTFTLLVVVPLVYRFVPLARRLVDSVGLPVAPTYMPLLYGVALLAAAVIGVHLGTLGPGPRSRYGLQPNFDDEYLEFFLSCLFFIASASGWRLTPVLHAERPRVFVASANLGD